jgi:hypothetical protein
MVSTIQNALKYGIYQQNRAMIAFQYDHIWVKKLFFELKYISLSFQESSNMDLFIQQLYKKYIHYAR